MQERFPGRALSEATMTSSIPRTTAGFRRLLAITMMACTATSPGATGGAIAAGTDARAARESLVAAYPDALSRQEDDHVYWRDGTVMAASDGVAEKSFDQLL